MTKIRIFLRSKMTKPAQILKFCFVPNALKSHMEVFNDQNKDKAIVCWIKQIVVTDK